MVRAIFQCVLPCCEASQTPALPTCIAYLLAIVLDCNAFYCMPSPLCYSLYRILCQELSCKRIGLQRIHCNVYILSQVLSWIAPDSIAHTHCVIVLWITLSAMHCILCQVVSCNCIGLQRILLHAVSGMRSPLYYPPARLSLLTTD